MSEPIVGPYEMGKQLLDALGLADVRGITKLSVSVEGGSLPKLHIERTITKREAGVFCALLRSWDCEIQPGPVTERPLCARPRWPIGRLASWSAALLCGACAALFSCASSLGWLL